MGTTLQGRDLDGNLTTAEAYYDTTLGITWLADVNYGVTTKTWAEANTWAASLDPYNSGITGWRLPDINPINGSSYNYTYAYDGSTDHGYNVSAPGTIYAGSARSEMAHMFHVTLGNTSHYDTNGVERDYIFPNFRLANTGLFYNIQTYYYWSASEYAPNASDAWGFGFYNSHQGFLNKSYYGSAWVVHSGDIGTALPTSAVPLPASIWLLGSGLATLIGFSKQRKSS